MGINWNVITEKHVAEACKAVAQRTVAGKAPRRGLVVSFDGQMWSQPCGPRQRVAFGRPAPLPQTRAPPTGTIYLRHGNFPN